MQGIPRVAYRHALNDEVRREDFVIIFNNNLMKAALV